MRLTDGRNSSSEKKPDRLWAWRAQQEVLQQRRMPEQLDVLERARDAQRGDSDAAARW